jgi:hypothetical protein
MRCRDVQRIIDLGSGPGLAGPQCEQVQAHLSSCSECRQALERQTRLQSLLQACEIPAVPEEFADRVLARVASQPIVLPLSAVPRPGCRNRLGEEAAPSWGSWVPLQPDC